MSLLVFTGVLGGLLFLGSVACLLALFALAWHADRRDPLTVVTAPPVPELLGCPTGCGDPGCAGDCTWVTAGALAELRRRLNEEDSR